MNNVSQHYDRLATGEWERLSKDAYHHLEFHATMECLNKHLPVTGRVLDVGGGPGRYSIDLCRRGYRVALVDYSEKCIELARVKFAAESKEVQTRLERAETGDVRDLSRFADASFDAVLCLGGPMSHLLELSDRRRAIGELVRVTKTDGLVFISVMGFLSHLRRILSRSPGDLVKGEREALFSNGNHLYTGGYCDAHFYRPDELKTLAEEAGLETVEMRACEGLSSNFPEATNALKEQKDNRWKRWLAILDSVQHDPAIVATSEHFLYVGQVRK